jgi:hypothetical protein
VVIDPHAGYRRRPSGLPEARIAVSHSHLIPLENKAITAVRSVSLGIDSGRQSGTADRRLLPRGRERPYERAPARVWQLHRPRPSGRQIRS